ncbi:uncharacterized protein DEA37_0013226, partial [Paragonimus westermani]
MVMKFALNGLSTEVRPIKMHHESLPEAWPSDNVSFNIKTISAKDIRRGNVAVASTSENMPPPTMKHKKRLCAAPLISDGLITSKYESHVVHPRTRVWVNLLVNDFTDGTGN